VPFDARPLLAKYGTVNLGTHRVEALHLSERGKYDANRYYHCVDKINLP
jgi:activating signal cointegrator complex subunit 1